MRSPLSTTALLLISCISVCLGAQQPPAAIVSLQFLSGHWTSTEGSEFQEEYWSPAAGANIVGTFRVVRDGKPVFYEFWTIEEEAGVAVFKMKHFNAGLVGWEDKADVVRMPVKQIGRNFVVFAREDGNLSLRYERQGNNLVSTLIHVKDGVRKEDVFRLRRQ